MAFSTSHRCVLFIRTILYGISAISSFFVFGALAASMNRHGQRCLLFAEAVGSKHYKYSSRTPCDYSIAVAVIFCLVCPLVIIVVTVLTFLAILKDKLVSLNNSAFLLCVSWDLLSFVFILSAASVISAGLKRTCDAILRGKDLPCSQASATPDTSDQDYFFKGLAIAEGGAWVAFMTFLVQLMIDLGILYATNRLPCGTRITKRESTSPQVSNLNQKF